jgi:hypothetical protein
VGFGVDSVSSAWEIESSFACALDQYRIDQVWPTGNQYEIDRALPQQ